MISNQQLNHVNVEQEIGLRKKMNYGERKSRRIRLSLKLY